MAISKKVFKVLDFLDITEKYKIVYGLDENYQMFLEIGEIIGERERILLEPNDIAAICCVLDKIEDNFYIGTDWTFSMLEEEVQGISDVTNLFAYGRYQFEVNGKHIVCSSDDLWLMKFYFTKYLGRLPGLGQEI